MTGLILVGNLITNKIAWEVNSKSYPVCKKPDMIESEASASDSYFLKGES